MTRDPNPAPRRKEVVPTTTADLRTPEGQDEAQNFVGSVFESGVVRNGKPVSVEQVTVPEEFYEVAVNAVVEQLTLASNEVLYEYPRLAADSVVNRLVKDEYLLVGEDGLSPKNVQHVRDLVELEIRRGVERVTSNARERFRVRLPLTFRSLIPLISRRRSH